MNRFRRTHRLQGAAAFLVALFSLNPAQSQPAEPKKVQTIEGITEYRLDNGLQVLLYPDPSSSRVTVNLTVLVGSRHEGYGETGMAHLLEHMLFKGSAKFPDVPRALRDHGADFNGTTWVDRTNYFETLPASEKNLDFALRLEADRLVNSFVRRDDLVSEMTVVRNEFEALENSPEAILSQRMTAVAYEWHNYGKTTIGNRSDIERVPIEKLQAFYRKYYQPDNAVLIVAGRFDPKKTIELVGKYFGPIKKPARQLDKTYTEEPAQDGEREVVLRRVGKVGACGAVYHIPSAAHADFPACEVLANLLDYEPGGRLYKALVVAKKATQVNAGVEGYHDPGTLEILAQVDSTDDKKIREARDVMLDVLEHQLGKEPFAQEDVDRVKRKLLKQRELLMSDANEIGVTLSDWAAKGDWRLFFLHRDRLEKVTPDDVARVVEKYLQASNRTSGLFLPTEKTQRTPIPESPKVAELVKDYKGRTAVAAGEEFEPTPENIEARIKRETLPSGVKTSLLPKKTRGNNVFARLTLRYGSAESLKGKGTAPDFLGEMMRRGTKEMTRQQLDDELDKLNAKLNLGGDAGSVTAEIQCKRETFPAVLKLLGKVLREPSFPADELDVLKRQQLEQLGKEKTEPMMLAQRVLRRKMTPYDKDDVRYVPTTDEEIERVKALTPEQLKDLYAEQLSGQHGEFVAVGDFDPAEATRLVNEALKDWKTKTAYKRIGQKAFADLKGEKVVLNTPDKANAMYIAAEMFEMKDTDPRYPALLLGNYLLGEAPLASWLSNRVRGKDGLSYAVGSQFNAGSQDPAAAFVIYAICNPENVAKVDAAIADELKKFLDEGVKPKEVEEGIKAYLLAAKNRRAQDDVLLIQLAALTHLDRTYTVLAEREKKVAALTADEVNKAVRQTLEPKRLIVIEAGDFKKAPKK